MKKLIFKKLFRDISLFFIVLSLCLTLIIWVIQAVNFLDFVSEDGHGLRVYFAYTFLNFPKVVSRLLPFVFFLSLFYTIIKYENNNELNIFWINGVSKFKFINIMIIFSIILMCFQIWLGSYLSPMSQLKARNLIKNSNVDFFTSLIREGKFINAVKGLTIFAEKKDVDNFSNIFIDDSSKGYTRMIYAKSGKILSDKKDKQFLLFNGKVINIDKARINTFEFDQINFNLQSFGSNSITQPKIQEIDSKTLLNCVFKKNTTNNKQCGENNMINETKQELLKRFFKPIYILLITILSCFLFISGKYNPDYDKIKRYIFLFIFLIIIISETSLRYATSSDISLLIYFLTPISLFIIFYIFTYFKINNV